MKKVLITGATGFIGRHCLPLLVEKGYEVHAVARRTPQWQSSSKVSWHQTDLLQPGSASELLKRIRPSLLLHLAWYAVPQKFWDAPENLMWVRSSLDLLQSFSENGGERVVAAGTCAEYDWGFGECLEDETPLHPATLYGTCKHALAQILQAWSRQTGLSSAWGRVFFVYGPHEHSSRVVAYVVQSLLQGKPALCSDGLPKRDFLHVEDVARAFVLLLESDVRGAVNIGSGHPVALRDVLLQIGECIGRPELIRLGDRNSGTEAAAFWANNEKLSKQCRWVPRYDLQQGIEQTVEWWRHSATARERGLG
jgi:nucleoside-diphosphate-sugar epimerase